MGNERPPRPYPRCRSKSFLDEVRSQIHQNLTEDILDLNGVKFQLSLRVQLRKISPGGRDELTSSVLRHNQEAVLQAHDIDEALNRAFPRILETFEKWTQRGSGWVVDRVETLWLDIGRYQPLRGVFYIPLPAALKNKKAIINVKNNDDICLRRPIRSALFPVDKNPQRPANYPTTDDLNFTDVSAPTSISQIPRVEKQNNLALNVFGWDKGVIVRRLSKQPVDKPRINLLLPGKAGKFHYTWVKDLNRLLYDQGNFRERKHFCERCIHGYSREDLLEAHTPECRGIGQNAVRVEMPEEGKNKVLFQNHHKQLYQHLISSTPTTKPSQLKSKSQS